MQVSVETTSNIERRMTIGVPADKVDQEVEKRLQQTARTVKMNGFRPGKVPLKVVRRRFSEGVRQEVIGEVMRDSYMQALEQEAISPAGWPQFEPKVMEAGKDLEFIAVFEVMPEPKLGDLAELNIEKPVAEIQAADIDKMIDNLRQQQAENKEVKRASKNKDIMTIDFVGKIEGEVFEGGTATDHRLTLGSGQMIPGFEDGLVGAKTGDEVTLEVNFPEDYQNKELAGKAATFDVTVKKVEEPELPELNKEFFEKFGITGETEEDFRGEVEKNMQRELKSAINNKLKNQIVDELLKTSELAVPKALAEQEINRLKEDAVRQFGGQMDASQLPNEIFQDQAERRVKTGLIFQELIRAHDLTADDAKLEEKIQEIASTYQEPEEVIEFYKTDPQQKAQLESLVLEDAVVELVMSKAKVEDKNVSYEDAIKPAQPGQASE